ncbi:ATP-grasp domain-containing protein [Legionella micdadei]|nr:ATP-grasp domain-containing protein [Legionella micdadei]NSL18397.1 ATP-grasp domain-containing protein [Legionella micdadei]
MITRNFHQISFKEVEPILLKYIRLYGRKNINLLTNEESTQLVCAQLREKYCIPGNKTEQLLPFVNKIVSKNKLQGKIRTPNFIQFNKSEYKNNPPKYLQHLINKIGFPMFIKPIDLVSSIGTHYITDLNTLKSAVEQILVVPYEFEVDEYIEGDLYHCDMLVHNNEIRFFMAGKYAYPLARFSKGSPMGSIPVKDEKLLTSLEEFSRNILINLGFFSSAFHIEIFRKEDSGELIFLEAAARTPGALVPNMYEIIFNVHLEELHYKVQIEPSYDLKINKSGNYAGWLTFPKIKGKLIEVKSPSIPINNKIINFVQSGEELEQAQSLLDSSCSIVFWDECFQKLEETFESLKNHQPLILHTT